MEETPKKKRKWLRILIFVLINVVVIGYTAWSEFGKNRGNAARFQDIELQPIFLLAALGCFAVGLFAESAKYSIMMRRIVGRRSPALSFKAAALGKYYDYITPSGIGGQPFQIYYLTKNGLSAAQSATLPIIGFISMQFAFVILAVVSFIFGPGDFTLAVKIAAYIGICFYLFIPAAIVFFSAFPKPTIKILSFGIRVLTRFKIIKDPETAKENSLNTLSQYSEYTRIVLSRKVLPFGILFYALIYQAAICSVPFFVLRAFGSTITWWESFTTVFFIYSAITFIPTPGNAGAAEGSFYAVFSSLSAGITFWAMLCWRFICFYLFIILGIVITAFDTVKSRRKEEPCPEEKTS